MEQIYDIKLNNLTAGKARAAIGNPKLSSVINEDGLTFGEFADRIGAYLQLEVVSPSNENKMQARIDELEAELEELKKEKE